MCFDSAFSCSRRSSDVNWDPMHELRLKRKLQAGLSTLLVYVVIFLVFVGQTFHLCGEQGLAFGQSDH